MAKKDFNQLAKYIVEIATGETPNPTKHKKPKATNQQKGGLKGGKARAEKLTPEQRKEIASKAAKKRWGK
jgi:hypothetical protein